MFSSESKNSDIKRHGLNSRVYQNFWLISFTTHYIKKFVKNLTIFLVFMSFDLFCIFRVASKYFTCGYIDGKFSSLSRKGVEVFGDTRERVGVGMEREFLPPTIGLNFSLETERNKMKLSSGDFIHGNL